jgi:hypothetical protein
MVRENVGPKSAERIHLRQAAHEGQAWARQVAL